jgi:hypothetical protein
MADPPGRAADTERSEDLLAAVSPPTASTLAQRQDCLEQADQWKHGGETRGDMVARSYATPAIAFA